MKQSVFFPEFSAEIQRNLSIWRTVIKDNPDYLEDPKCPYTGAQILLLKEIFLPEQGSDLTEGDPIGDSLGGSASGEIDIEKEAKSIYQEMKSFKNALDISDVTEKASMFRVTTSLLEKLLDMAERAKGIKQFEQFEQLIIDTLDRYLDPKQKAEFVSDVNLLLRGKDV